MQGSWVHHFQVLSTKLGFFLQSCFHVLSCQPCLIPLSEAHGSPLCFQLRLKKKKNSVLGDFPCFLEPRHIKKDRVKPILSGIQLCRGRCPALLVGAPSLQDCFPGEPSLIEPTEEVYLLCYIFNISTEL